MVYYLSSIFGLAKGKISKKPDNTYTLHIELTPKGHVKIAGYLTQSRHVTRRDAKKSWDSLGDYIESKLIELT